MRASTSLLTAALVAVAAAAALQPVSLQVTPNAVTLSNGYATMTFNLNRGSVDVLQGRFEGDGNFATAPNLSPALPYDMGAYKIPSTPQGALSLVVIGNGSSLGETSTSSLDLPAPLVPNVLTNTAAYAAFSVAMVDGSLQASGPRVSAVIMFGLAQADRAFTVNVTSATLPGSSSFTAAAITLRLWFSPQSSMVGYSTGWRQGKEVNSPFLAAQVPWERFIGIGRRGCVDMAPRDNITGGLGTILWGGEFNNVGSGVELVLAGSVRDNGWSDGLEYVTPTTIQPGTPLPSVSLTLAPNNYDFPAGVVPTSGPQTLMNVDDQRSILTASFASPMGALHSYDFAPETRIAPCIDIGGNNCYGGLYNFFDPDSFLSVSALLWSFEPNTLAAAKGLIETNLRFLCPGNGADGLLCEGGQMMHHFVPNCDPNDHWCWCTTDPGFKHGDVGYETTRHLADLHARGTNTSAEGRLGSNGQALKVCLTYEAISGAVQTGPNIFHLWAALRVAAATGDMPWLSANMPAFRQSLDFLLRRLDTSNLFYVPGSLMIDTFIRNNYTLDTNAAMVILMEKAADAEAALGNSTGAAALTSLAASVRTAISQYLWSPENDHLCTQANKGASAGAVIPCARDFVDYDANLLAVAAGVVTGAQAQAVLARIDSGPCTHQHATWVSEKFYDSNNCFSQNTGDSAVSMGRISWLDAMARRAVDTPAANTVLQNLILGPIQAELLANTWMYERYQCQAKPTHNNYYIEMPEIVSMILVETKYGLDFSSWSTFTVNPALGVPSFVFAPAAGSPAVQYNSTAGFFSAMLPYVTPGTRTFKVTRMPQGSYTVSSAVEGKAAGSGSAKTTAVRGAAGSVLSVPLGSSITVPVGPDGVLTFSAPVGAATTVTAQLQG